LGWDFSKPSTDERNPLKRVFEGFRILLGARGFVGGNLREAGNAFGLFVVVFASLPTSDLSVPSNWSNSRLRSSLTASAPRTSPQFRQWFFRSWFPFQD